MKNTVRARKNGATKRTASQGQTIEVKSKFGPEFDLPKDAPHHACLAIFSREEQGLVSKIPLSEEEFNGLWRMTVNELMKLPPQATANLTPGHVIAGWLRARLQMNSVLNEFESAKAQSHALHTLLLEATKNKADGTYGEEIQFGLSELICQTTGRMDRVYATIHKQEKGVAP